MKYLPTRVTVFFIILLTNGCSTVRTILQPDGFNPADVLISIHADLQKKEENVNDALGPSVTPGMASIEANKTISKPISSSKEDHVSKGSPEPFSPSSSMLDVMTNIGSGENAEADAFNIYGKTEHREKNRYLESAGYTRPTIPTGTSKTINDCIDRMHRGFSSSLVSVCVNKIKFQKKAYLSPSEAQQLHSWQEYERKWNEKK